MPEDNNEDFEGTLSYIEDMLSQLRVMSDKSGTKFLSYLIDMCILEARITRERGDTAPDINTLDSEELMKLYMSRED